MAFIPASLITHIVREREEHIKHQQVVKGVSLLAYWLSNFIVDLLKYLVPALISPFFVYAFDLTAVTENGNFKYFYLLFAIYGPSMILFVYVCSFLHKDYGNVQLIQFFFNFIIGGIESVTFAILWLVDTTKYIAIYLHYIFCIFPCFSYAYGITNLSSIKAYQLLYNYGIAFANKYKDFNWDCAFFSDESSFYTHQYSIKTWKFDDQQVSFPQPKHPEKIHAWAAISKQGISCLFLFDQTLDSEFFCEMLKEILIPDSKVIFKKKKWILVQDNDPKHTSKKSIQFYEDNNIQLLKEYPSSNPDLNPIENIWAWVKSKLKNKVPKTQQELMDELLSIWDSIPQEIIISTIDSMPQRLKAVINNQGGFINY